MANDPTKQSTTPHSEQPAPAAPNQPQLGESYASGYSAGFQAGQQACQQRAEALQQTIGGTSCVTICADTDSLPHEPGE